MRRSLLSLGAFMSLAGPSCGSGSDPPEPPVSISPANPSLDDVVEVRALTLYGEGERGDGSNYHFTLAGPTGRDCSASFESAVGIPAWERRSTERDGAVVLRRYYPTRTDDDPLTREKGAEWCPGTYNGAVEWREPGSGSLKRRRLASGITIFGKLVGTYSFQVHVLDTFEGEDDEAGRSEFPH